MTACPICAAGQPFHVRAELAATWVTAPPLVPLPGYLCLVAKHHVRDPFELSDPERRAFWDDVDRVAKAAVEALRPDNLNYEIHGNTIDHLHLHLYPRRQGDRFAGRPIDGRDVLARDAADEASVDAILGRLVDGP